MLQVARTQIIKPSSYQVGDQVHIPLVEKTYTATAVKREKDGMLFVFDNCLDKRRYMDLRGMRFKGIWEQTSLRRLLQQISFSVPKKIKNQMVPFYNGDLFRLLTQDEILPRVGNNNFIPYFELREKRIKSMIDGCTGANYWLMTSKDYNKYHTSFCYVDYSGIIADDYTDMQFGVVPVFKLKDGITLVNED